MDAGAWWAAVHGVAKSRTRLSDFTFTFHFPALEGEALTTQPPGKFCSTVIFIPIKTLQSLRDLLLLLLSCFSCVQLCVTP